MLKRFTPTALDSTEQLLAEILQIILTDDSRACFLVPAGEAQNVLARIRVMRSRIKRRMEQKGRKTRQFQLNSTVHPETHDGKRMDCIIMWKKVHDSHIMAEELEDLLAK